MTNSDLSACVFKFLQQAGVEQIVVCAGARNAPFVLGLQSEKFQVLSFFEERSAAFFAMGLCKAHSRPVAVITTSGTAAAELLPATIEAAYQGLPLVLITADRPHTYRGTGSPQTIDQVDLFKNYVENEYDLDVKTDRFEFTWSKKKPIHLNVSFDEPLVDQRSANLPAVKFNQPADKALPKATPIQSARPLIIVGELEASAVEKVVNYILQTRAPVYAESLSRLKSRVEVQPYLIKSTDQLLRQLFQNQFCDSVVRIGGVPTLRFWRDLEYGFKQVPVFNYTQLPFSGLSRPSSLMTIGQLQAFAQFPVETLNFIKKVDLKLQQEKEVLLKRYPLSEPSLTQQLSELTKEMPTYLGNSLPIRLWDQFVNSPSPLIYANRGANGIDGQISTYLGWSDLHNTSFCLVGDLTALYDMASLGLAAQLQQKKRFVVIMNNFGGQIFKRVFKNDQFVNAHQIQFYHWAKMWNWSYLTITQVEDFPKIKTFNTNNIVVEIVPDAEQTEKFWNEWDQLCHNL